MLKRNLSLLVTGLFLFIFRTDTSGTEPSVNAQARDQDGITDLMRAIRDGKRSAFKSLVRGSPDINAQDIYGWTAFTYAAVRADIEAEKILLRKGADPNGQDTDGCTPLMAEMIYGRAYVTDTAVKFLIDSGADPNRSNKNGSTPLLAAVSHGLDSAVKVLLRAGADPRHPDGKGITPMMAAITYGKKADEALAKASQSGAPLNRPDRTGVVPAEAADTARNRSKAMIELLKKAGAGDAAQADNSATTELNSPGDRTPEPIYPSSLDAKMKELLRSKPNGAYVMLLLVGGDGSVKKVRILIGLPGFTDVIAEAALTQRFHPATKNGQPAEHWTKLAGAFITKRLTASRSGRHLSEM